MVIPTTQICFYAISSHTWTCSIAYVRMNVMRTTLRLVLVIVPSRPRRELLTSTINGAQPRLLTTKYFTARRMTL
jgi:hypothetical protein